MLHEQTAAEQAAYDYYKSIEAENFRLKNDLASMRKEEKRLKGIIKSKNLLLSAKNPNRNKKKERGTYHGD